MQFIVVLGLSTTGDVRKSAAACTCICKGARVGRRQHMPLILRRCTLCPYRPTAAGNLAGE
jgi:hypothetical protein